MLIHDIKSKSLAARKAADTDAAALLVTLYSEAAMKGKNDGNRDSTDAEVVSVVKKFIDNIEDSLPVIQDEARRAKLRKELEILNQFVPRQFSKEELHAMVENLRVEMGIEKTPKAMGTLMKFLKERYSGQYDAKLASEIVRSVLN